MKLIRTFLAVPVTMEILSKVSDAVSKLKPQLREVRFVNVNNLHITVRFFGEISAGDIEEIHRKLVPVAASATPFTLAVSGMGVFPNIKHPRVIWVGLKDIENKLSNLVKEVSKAAGHIGKREKHKKFNPHITIARIRQKPDTEKIKNICMEYENALFGKYAADRMILFQSILKKEGAKYTAIKMYPFGS